MNKDLHWNVPLDEEYLNQTNEDIFDIAQKTINLAHDILTAAPEVQESALAILNRYADIHKLQVLPGALRRQLYVMNYGESEVAYMEKNKKVNFD